MKSYNTPSTFQNGFGRVMSVWVQVESSELASHAVELLDKHFDVLFTKVAGVERALYGPSQSSRSRGSVAYTSTSAERSLTDRLTDVERTLDEGVRNATVVVGGRGVNDASAAVDASTPAAAAAAAAAAANGSGGDVQSILVSTSEKMTIYEGVITVLNREVEKLSTQVCLTFWLQITHYSHGLSSQCFTVKHF